MPRITEVASKVFFDSIEAQGRALQRVTLVNNLVCRFLGRWLTRAQDHNDLSLTPPIAILDHALILKEIMAVFQSSILGDEAESELISGFERVLDIAIDPAIEMCINAAEEKARAVQRWDMPVFVLNCLSYLLVKSFPV